MNIIGEVVSDFLKKFVHMSCINGPESFPSMVMGAPACLKCHKIHKINAYYYVSVKYTLLYVMTIL